MRKWTPETHIDLLREFEARTDRGGADEAAFMEIARLRDLLKKAEAFLKEHGKTLYDI